MDVNEGMKRVVQDRAVFDGRLLRWLYSGTRPQSPGQATSPFMVELQYSTSDVDPKSNLHQPEGDEKALTDW